VPSIRQHSMRISASTDELEKIRSFVASHAGEFGFSETDVNDIVLAVDEACTNIIKHAYEWNPEKNISVSVAFRNNEMLVSIIDEGKPFDPGSYQTPKLEEQLKNKKRSGYGILLIRKLMDNVEYRKRQSRNEIRMTKKR